MHHLSYLGDLVSAHVLVHVSARRKEALEGCYAGLFLPEFACVADSQVFLDDWKAVVAVVGAAVVSVTGDPIALVGVPSSGGNELPGPFGHFPGLRHDQVEFPCSFG